MSLYLSDGFIMTRNVTGCCFMKSLLGKGGKTDFQVRPWGIRRTRKSVVPLNQQAGERGTARRLRSGLSLAYRLVALMGWYSIRIALSFRG